MSCTFTTWVVNHNSNCHRGKKANMTNGPDMSLVTTDDLPCPPMDRPRHRSVGNNTRLPPHDLPSGRESWVDDSGASQSRG